MPKILKTKKILKKQNKILTCLLTVLKGLIAFVLGFFIVSLIIYKVNDSAFYYYLVFALISLGAFITGFISYKKLGGRGILCGLFSAAIYLIFLLLIILITMKFNVSSRLLPVIPICLISGILGGIVGANK
ncbi:MAG: TIGR04086 family membrane protein [Clostridia bacterium]|nr:TIGR04086 family membrane protein [Clostridia bacterium]